MSLRFSSLVVPALLGAAGLLWPPAPAARAAATGSQPARRAELSVVRVNSTNQPYDFFRPWSKKTPFERHGLGAVLPGNKVLVTAELVANHEYIDLEKAESGEKAPARVVCVDYEANLALLAPTEDHADFLAGLKPLEISTDTVVGNRVQVLQLESNDALMLTPGPVTTIEVGRYQLENTHFLLYRLSLPLQYREGSFTAPVIDKDNRLVGVLMRYDPRSQTLDVIPSPIVNHFLKDDADHPGHYQGFPAAGIEFAPTRDPQLRHFARLPAAEGNSGGGIYVTTVAAHGPAEAAGLRAGDVLTEVAGHAVDQDGNYLEARYGKISVSHLFTQAFVGEKVPLKVLRDGQPMEFALEVQHRPATDYVVQPYLIDQAPRYYVAGGLIFQELSRQYLKEWGPDWLKRAPLALVYLDRYQDILVKDGRRRVVVLSQILPAASNLGYEDIGYQIVRTVNGQTVSSLDDLPKALGQVPPDGFDRIEFQDFPHVIFLDAARLEEDNQKIKQAYGLPATSRLEAQ